MEDQELEKLRYPIGKFVRPEFIDEDLIREWIDALEEFPAKLRALVSGMSDDQLETTYRPGGWRIRQLIHHIADSHHNSYIRFKWGLTEDKPLIKVYDEKKWAALHDSRKAPITLSLDHLQSVHSKLVYLLRGLERKELQREFIHPDGQVVTSLEENIGRYVWHGNHHYAHIANLVEREGW